MDKKLLEKLCERYSFSWDTIGYYVRITSKRGTYYILDEDHQDRPIKLYHENFYAGAGMHFHGKHDDINCIMKSIKSHDEIYNVGSRHNKFTRMTEIFNQLHSAC